MNQIAVILTDAERRILWANKDFEAISGYSLGEVMGRVAGKILQGPNTEPAALERIRVGLQGQEPFKTTVTNYRKNGEAYPCKLVIHPIFNHRKELTNYSAFEVDGSVVKNENRIALLNLSTRYRSSSLREADELELYGRVKEAMEAEQLYVDPNLTLRKLADHLDTNTKYLSQVINNQGQVNFLTFVNNYRIAAVRKRLDAREHRKQTFFGIAQYCGFKNKSTFYKVFRDLTGGTPKVYCERLAAEGKTG